MKRKRLHWNTIISQTPVSNSIWSAAVELDDSARAAGEEGRRDYFHDFDDMWTAKEEDARRKKEAQDKEEQRQRARRKKVRFPWRQLRWIRP